MRLRNNHFAGRKFIKKFIPLFALALFLLPSTPQCQAVHRKLSEIVSITGTEVFHGTAPLAEPKKVVIAYSDQDHGPGEHDYPLFASTWKDLLGGFENLSSEAAWGFPDSTHFETADVIIFYMALPDISEEQYALMDAYQARGGGMIFLHEAVIQRSPAGPNAGLPLSQRIGLASSGGSNNGNSYQKGIFEIDFTMSPNHPIVNGFPEFMDFDDEIYWNLVGDPGAVSTLGTSSHEGGNHPILYAYEKGDAKVFVSIFGHHYHIFDDPVWRIIFTRSLAWTLNEDTHTFAPLVIAGSEYEADILFIQPGSEFNISEGPSLMVNRSSGIMSVRGLWNLNGQFIYQVRDSPHR